MDRRTFIQTGVAAGVVATADRGSAAAKRGRRPNLLYVFDDEHRFQSMPGQPFSDPVTAPALHAFRGENFSMERCVSNYPLCSPHRGILMTGLWPYQNGITRNWLQLGTNFESLGHVFDKAGYNTAYVGKWHLSGPGFDRAFVPAGPHRQGFQNWHVWGAVDKHMNASFTFDPDTGEKIHPMGYQATLMTDEAVKIIQDYKGSENPWMMIVSYHPPHFPVDDAPADDEAFFAEKQVQLRPNVKTGVSDRGAVRTQESIEKFHQGYYAHIRAIDREFARLLKTLDETGQSQDTIVVFTSDHGEMGGSHGRMYKQVPFEESTHVPFFVRYPGVTPHGKTCDALFASIDIYPTLCGLAGIPVPPQVRGRDQSFLIRGEKGPESDVVFLMNGDSFEAEPGADGLNGGTNGGGYAPPTFRGLCTRTHTYAVAADGRWLLFDNVRDPYQQKNLIDDPAEQARMEHFNELIAAWLKDASDPFPYEAALDKRSAQPA
jgi:arylsulfatase A-like enzyme